MARVLLVDDEVPSRLTLQTVLRAGGYAVESAASAAEAIHKMDDSEYDLVLTDLRLESPEAGLKVLAHARMKEYKPATALVTAYLDSKELPLRHSPDVVVEAEDVVGLLTRVADLIGMRASRRVERQLRHSVAY